MFITPTVVGDTLYVGSCAGVFYAFERETGEILWEYDTNIDGATASFHGEMLADETSVVVGTDHPDGGCLYSFAPDSGELHWKHCADSGYPADLMQSGTSVLAATVDGALHSFDLERGRLRWAMPSAIEEPGLRGSPVLVGKHVIYGTPGGELTCLDATSGNLIWSTDVSSGINTSLALFEGSLYAGVVDGAIYRVDPATGAIRGKRETPGAVYGALLPVEGCLVALWEPDTIACLEPSLKQERWSHTTGGEAWSSFRPLVRGDEVLAGTTDGDVIAFALEDGKRRWTKRLGGTIRGIGTRGDRLYIGTFEGVIYALKQP